MSLLTLLVDILADELVQWLPTRDAVEFYYRTCKYLRENCGDRAMRANMPLIKIFVDYINNRHYQCKVRRWRNLTMPYATALCIDLNARSNFPTDMWWLDTEWTHPFPVELRVSRLSSCEKLAAVMASAQENGARVKRIQLSDPGSDAPLPVHTPVFPNVTAVKISRRGTDAHTTERHTQLMRNLRTIFPKACIISGCETIDSVARESSYVPREQADVVAWPDRVRRLYLGASSSVLHARDEQILRMLATRADLILVEHNRVDDTSIALLKHVLPRTEVSIIATAVQSIDKPPTVPGAVAAHVTRMTLLGCIFAPFETMHQRGYDFLDARLFTSMRELIVGLHLVVYAKDKTFIELYPNEIIRLREYIEQNCQAAFHVISEYGGLSDATRVRLTWETAATPRQLDAAIRALYKFM